MALIQFEIPADKIQFLKEKIDFLKNKLQTLPDGDSKKRWQANCEILERFTPFLQKETNTIAVFELTNKGMDLRSSANLDISLALSKGGIITYLEDEILIAKIKSELYPNDKQNSERAQFADTAFPLVFEWWEKFDKSSDDEWKGVIKLPKLFISSDVPNL